MNLLRFILLEIIKLKVRVLFDRFFTTISFNIVTFRIQIKETSIPFPAQTSNYKYSQRSLIRFNSETILSNTNYLYGLYIMLYNKLLCILNKRVSILSQSKLGFQYFSN